MQTRDAKKKKSFANFFLPRAFPFEHDEISISREMSTRQRKFDALCCYIKKIKFAKYRCIICIFACQYNKRLCANRKTMAIIYSF